MRRAALLAFGLLLSSSAVAVPPLPPPSREIDALHRDVDRAESLRAVKNLQRIYAQYAQYGLWPSMAALFAGQGRFIFDGKTYEGRAAIAVLLRSRYGDGHDGVLPGDVRTMMIEAPVVNLSEDGRSAKGRWQVMIFTGRTGVATIEGGIFENDYVRDKGGWKIAAARYSPQYSGPYESGWTNWGGGDLGIVPYHFTPDTAGIPIPAAVGPAPAARTTLAQLTRRIGALNDEDQIRNLQSAYGFYADRKMWEDVADLFADHSAVEVGGAGIWRGKAGVRRWLAAIGPAGLKHGELNDRPQFDTVVEIAPGGREAWARGIELGMLGEADREQGAWEISVFYNRFVKEGGVWKIRELRRFPLVKADYFLGWGKSRIVDPNPAGANAPDEKSTVGIERAWLAQPQFIHPHGIELASRPTGQAAVVATALTSPVPATPQPSLPLAELRRQLAVSTAYDGVENVSTAYGNFLDDFKSEEFGALMAEKGFKVSAFAGYYVGRDRIIQAGKRVWGTKAPVTRPGISYHWRTQPVILVAADGRAANARFRLFQPRTSKTVDKPGDFYGASFWGGMYHDQFVVENGRWRFWNLSLDEPYINPVGWKGGWAMAKDPPAKPSGAASPLVGSTFPPDIPITLLGKRMEHFRGGTGETLQWPSILPMWFGYRNPVSGRVPALYTPDCVPCGAAPQLRLDRNGYLMPPDGAPPGRMQSR